MVLDEIGAFIAANGLATEGVDLFANDEPDKPSDIVTLYEYGGSPPVRLHPLPGIALEFPRVQIQCRGADSQATRIRAENIYKLLVPVENTMLSGVRYLSIDPQQQPFLIGRDANRRYLFGFNMEVTKTPS